MSHLVARVVLCTHCTCAVAEPSLIVVDDRGGVSARPYYEALSLRLPTDAAPAAPPTPLPAVPTRRVFESDMLPVRSERLTPGDVEPRALDMPGQPALVLIGDDPRSQSWLRQRALQLRTLGAVGLVVNIETAAALAALRALAPNVPLSPVPGDDLAQRLGIRHYPVLITATGIEQ